jgi:hypothetical protein
MVEEVRFFTRSAVFAIVIAGVYWYVSGYEPAGTILLLAFGLAGLLMATVLFRGSQGDPRAIARPWEWGRLSPADERSPFTDEETGRLPGPSVAPLAGAAGIALVLLSLVFGPVLAVAAIGPFFIAVRSWLGAAMSEWRAVERESDVVLPEVAERRTASVGPADKAEVKERIITAR